MKETIQQVIQRFKREHPRTSRWEDDEVIEAMLLLLSQENGSRVSVTGRQSDGKLIFRFDPLSDGSDGVQ
jgi:hypothetical protein